MNKLARKKTTKNKSIVVAVHIITESSDHYTMCLAGNTPEDIVEQIQDELKDEMSYVAQVWFSPLLENPELVESLLKEFYLVVGNIKSEME